MPATANAQRIIAAVGTAVLAATLVLEALPVAAEDLADAASTPVSHSDSIAAGLIRQGGSLESVLAAIEQWAASNDPQGGLEALDVVTAAARSVSMEPGYAASISQHALVISNPGGMLTTIGADASIPCNARHGHSMSCKVDTDISATIRRLIASAAQKTAPSIDREVTQATGGLLVYADMSGALAVTPDGGVVFYDFDTRVTSVPDENWRGVALYLR